MKKINITKGELHSDMLDLQQLPPLNTQVESSRLQTVECHSQLPKYLTGGSLQFLVEPSSLEYTSLHESFIYLKIKGIKILDNKESKFEEDDRTAYIPFISNTIFKQLRMSINDHEISSSLNEYFAYESMIQALCYISKEVQETRYSGGFQQFSEPGTQSVNDPTSSVHINGPFRERYLAATVGETVVAVPLLWCLWNCPKLLPSNTEIRLTLALNSSAFCLIQPEAQTTANLIEKSSTKKESVITIYDNTKTTKPTTSSPPKRLKRAVKNIDEKFDIKIIDAKLFVQRYRLTDTEHLRQERLLSSSGLLYPLNSLATITFNVEKGATGCKKSLFFYNKVPRVVNVYIVERDSTENINKDPFDFKGGPDSHYSVKQLYLEYNGLMYPNGEGYNLSSGSSSLPMNFHLRQQELNGCNANTYINSPATWKKGYTIFPISLVPDRSTCSDYISKSNSADMGPCTLHILFMKPLPEACTVFVTTETYEVLQIDNKRHPHWI